MENMTSPRGDQVTPTSTEPDRESVNNHDMQEKDIMSEVNDDLDEVRHGFLKIEHEIIDENELEDFISNSGNHLRDNTAVHSSSVLHHKKTKIEVPKTTSKDQDDDTPVPSCPAGKHLLTTYCSSAHEPFYEPRTARVATVYLSTSPNSSTGATIGQKKYFQADTHAHISSSSKDSIDGKRASSLGYSQSFKNQPVSLLSPQKIHHMSELTDVRTIEHTYDDKETETASEDPFKAESNAYGMLHFDCDIFRHDVILCDKHQVYREYVPQKESYQDVKTEQEPDAKETSDTSLGEDNVRSCAPKSEKPHSDTDTDSHEITSASLQKYPKPFEQRRKDWKDEKKISSVFISNREQFKNEQCEHPDTKRSSQESPTNMSNTLQNVRGFLEDISEHPRGQTEEGQVISKLTAVEKRTYENPCNVHERPDSHRGVAQQREEENASKLIFIEKHAFESTIKLGVKQSYQKIATSKKDAAKSSYNVEEETCNQYNIKFRFHINTTVVAFPLHRQTSGHSESQEEEHADHSNEPDEPALFQGDRDQSHSRQHPFTSSLHNLSTPEASFSPVAAHLLPQDHPRQSPTARQSCHRRGHDTWQDVGRPCPASRGVPPYPVDVLPVEATAALHQSACPANFGIHIRGHNITVEETADPLHHASQIPCQESEQAQNVHGHNVLWQNQGWMAMNANHQGVEARNGPVCRNCGRPLFHSASAAGLLFNCHHLVCRDCAVHVHECPVCGENVLCFMHVHNYY